MRLADWRREQGMTQEQLAALIGCSQPNVSLLERWPDNSVPQTKELMLRIYQVTRGAVTPNDFYDLPELGQAQLPLPPAPPPAAEPELELQPDPMELAA